MNIKTILYPTDFSDQSSEALEFASSLANDYGAKLMIVHAWVPPSQTGALVPLVDTPITSQAVQQKLLESVIPGRPNVEVEHHMVDGPPAKAIVDFANKHKIDLIVMSSHGETGLARLLMGSVAESVVRKAPCPTITVRRNSRVPEMSAN